MLNHYIDRLAIALGCKPQNVHITDQEPMLALMRRNIALNKLEDKVAASVYNWGEACPHPVPAHPDVVLAADCVYFEPAFPLLQATLQDLIGPNTTCYFCFKRRRRADVHFVKAIKKKFVVEVIEDDPDREAYARENIFLYVSDSELRFEGADGAAVTQSGKRLVRQSQIDRSITVSFHVRMDVTWGVARRAYIVGAFRTNNSATFSRTCPSCV